MTGPAGRGEGSGSSGSWEERAAGLASEVQRWLIRTSARNMRDELGDQVRKAFRGQEADPGDVWGTATTEPPRAADEAPECAWCPVCRAARRISEARSGQSAGGGSPLSDAADVMATAVSQVLSGLDSVLSYRPGEGTPPRRGTQQPAGSPAGGSQPRAEDRPTPAPRPEPSAEDPPTPAPRPEPSAEDPPTPAPRPEPSAEDPPTPAPRPEPSAEDPPTPAPRPEPSAEDPPTPAPRPEPSADGARTSADD
jgi:hypothetical protein